MTKENEKIIMDYMTKLSDQISKKNLSGIFVFTDEPFSKRFKSESNKLQKILKKDIEKYKKRVIAHISICTYHKDKEFREMGIWMTANIKMFKIDSEGKMNGKYKSWGTSIRWTEEDFKVSKISIKLIEKIMKVCAERKISITGTFGVPLREVVDDLKKYYKVDLEDYLSPLKKLK